MWKSATSKRYSPGSVRITTSFTLSYIMSGSRGWIFFRSFMRKEGKRRCLIGLSSFLMSCCSLDMGIMRNIAKDCSIIWSTLKTIRANLLISCLRNSLRRSRDTTQLPTNAARRELLRKCASFKECLLLNKIQEDTQKSSLQYLHISNKE